MPRQAKKPLKIIIEVERAEREEIMVKWLKLGTNKRRKHEQLRNSKELKEKSGFRFN
jgi:hypothetical protein